MPNDALFYLLDTNILVRQANASSPQRPLVVSTLKSLRASGAQKDRKFILMVNPLKVLTTAAWSRIIFSCNSMVGQTKAKFRSK